MAKKAASKKAGKAQPRFGSAEFREKYNNQPTKKGKGKGTKGAKAKTRK